MIVDSSVALKWFLDEPSTDKALLLLPREDLHEPDVIVPEILNGLRKGVRDQRISKTSATGAIRKIELAIPSLCDSLRLAERALEISLQLSHHINDCLYLAQALEMEADLVTADQAFVELVTRKEPALARRLIALEQLA